MTDKQITTMQEILFDLFDLIADNDDMPIAGFDEFQTLHQFALEQIAKLESLGA